VQLLAQVNRMRTDKWSKDDQIDWLLFRAQLEGPAFFDRVMDFEHSDPQTYVNECSNSIFSLLKKEYDAPRKRALSATARLRAMPAMLEQGKRNLTKPVKLYAQLAIDSARSVDPLFKDSMMTRLAKGLSKVRDGRPRHRARCGDQSDSRVRGLAREASEDDAAVRADGRSELQLLLKHVYLLPLDGKQVEMLGQTELARARAMESMLLDPSLADPDPSRAAVIPADQDDFLKAYERRETEIVTFLQDNKLVTLPSYLGRFEIRPTAGSVQADKSRRFHERARRLRQRSNGLLFHSHLQS
jgi:hypothetical protein